MIEVSFEIAGELIRRNAATDTFENPKMNTIAEQIDEKLSGIVDRKTGERPSVKVSGENLDNLYGEASASSADLARRATEVLESNPLF